MTATIPSAAIVPADPVFTGPEQLALAGFLASYSGLTRDAYMLDLAPATMPPKCRLSSRVSAEWLGAVGGSVISSTRAAEGVHGIYRISKWASAAGAGIKPAHREVKVLA
jgi:hypothetical protein